MALVELLLSPLPAHVRTARLVAVAAARRAGLGDELVDELRLAVGEACSRAVGLHSRHAPDRQVRLTVDDDVTGLTLTVIDAGPAAGPAPDDLTGGLGTGDLVTPDIGEGFDELGGPDVSLAVLRGLVDDMTVRSGADGTTVCLRWPLPAGVSGARSTVLAER
jgi:anti-sigma regulatory factor (Ser/Thr protein kinase)